MVVHDQAHEMHSSDSRISGEDLNENCDYTLDMMKEFERFDHDVVLSTSTTSRNLIDVLYTVKQVRVTLYN